MSGWRNVAPRTQSFSNLLSVTNEMVLELGAVLITKAHQTVLNKFNYILMEFYLFSKRLIQ